MNTASLADAGAELGGAEAVDEFGGADAFGFEAGDGEGFVGGGEPDGGFGPVG